MTDLLKSEHVLLDLRATSAQAIFESVAEVWQRDAPIDVAQVVDRLTAREVLGSTGLGKAVAIPHARIDGLNEPLTAFVRSETPVLFEAPDEQPVQLFFLLVVPTAAAEAHLSILARVVSCFADPAFRERVASAKEPVDVSRLFDEWISAQAQA